jgi:hypothetical protein
VKIVVAEFVAVTREL